MKKLYFLLFAVVTLTTVNAQNELTNGSFETRTAGTPDNWDGSKTNIAASAISENTTEAYEGTSSLALLSTGTSHKRFTNVAIAVTAINEEYTLRYYAKGTGDLRNAHNHNGTYSTYSNYITFTGTEGWTFVEYVFTPDAGPLEIIFSVRNGSGDGVLIDDVVLVKSSTLSTKKIAQADAFSVFPNPTAEGFVNIKSTKNGAIAVSVFDVLGKQVLSTTVNNNRLNVSSLNAGVYIMQLNQNGAVTTKKLVVK